MQRTVVCQNVHSHARSEASSRPPRSCRAINAAISDGRCFLLYGRDRYSVSGKFLTRGPTARRGELSRPCESEEPRLRRIEGDFNFVPRERARFRHFGTIKRARRVRACVARVYAGECVRVRACQYTYMKNCSSVTNSQCGNSKVVFVGYDRV